MVDIKKIRQNPEDFARRLKGRASRSVIDRIVVLDKSRRENLRIVEDLRARQKKISDSQSARKIKEERRRKEEELKRVSKELNGILSEIPNVPDDDVPEGFEDKNEIIEVSGRVPGEKGPPHWEIGKMLGIVDFETASKMTTSFWPLLKGDGARLEMALINFFIEENAKSGFDQICVPYAVNEKAVFGTGQLPKFADDLYRLENDNLYLIPTGEVPAGNLFRDKIFAEDELPLDFQIFSPCFRREAGSWGKLGKGLVRNHQFHKVEIFSFAKPEESDEKLKNFVSVVCGILEKLGFIYRVVLLSSGEMGFSAARTYDIEVWAKGMNRWLEVSSCSNCRDFQARRTNTRIKRKSGEIVFAHTLNGSSVAVGRVFAALLENNFGENGEVPVPDCLKKFMGKDRIEPFVATSLAN